MRISPAIWLGDDKKVYALFQEWFKKNVEPINKMLEQGVEVYCWDTEQNTLSINHEKRKADTHSALLINIQPIRQETAEDVLKDILTRMNISNDLKQRAKRVLNMD